MERTNEEDFKIIYNENIEVNKEHSRLSIPIELSSVTRNKIDTCYIYLTRYKWWRVILYFLISFFFYLGLSGIAQLFQPIHLDAIFAVTSLIIYLLTISIRFMHIRSLYKRIAPSNDRSRIHSRAAKIKHEIKIDYLFCVVIPSILFYGISITIALLNCYHVNYMIAIYAYCLFCTLPIVTYILYINKIISLIYSFVRGRHHNEN